MISDKRTREVYWPLACPKPGMPYAVPFAGFWVVICDEKDWNKVLDAAIKAYEERT